MMEMMVMMARRCMITICFFPNLAILSSRPDARRAMLPRPQTQQLADLQLAVATLFRLPQNTLLLFPNCQLVAKV